MGILVTNETVKQLFHIAQSVAKENYNANFGASHLLRALMHKDIGVRELLNLMDKDPNYIYEWADVRIEDYPKTSNLPSEVAEDEAISRIVDEADDFRLRLGLDEITPICVLAAIAKPGVGYSVQELKSLPLREHEILNFFQGETKTLTNVEKQLFDISTSAADLPAITAYCVDKLADSQNGKLDTIIGRDKEIRMLIEVLSIFSFGKMFHLTGWKIGYIIAEPELMQAFRRVHQYMTFCVNSPSQYALAKYLEIFDVDENRRVMQNRRDLFLDLMKETPFEIS